MKFNSQKILALTLTILSIKILKSVLVAQTPAKTANITVDPASIHELAIHNHSHSIETQITSLKSQIDNIIEKIDKAPKNEQTKLQTELSDLRKQLDSLKTQVK